MPPRGGALGREWYNQAAPDGRQKSDGSESNEAAADEPWRQVGGKHAVSDGTLVY